MKISIKLYLAIAFTALMPVSVFAQVGPTVFTPRLTVSPGPLTVTTGDTTVQDIIIQGTCTGCGAVSPASPTATLGLSVINGSAATFMRSDAAPALSQAIAPTWTNQHIFTQTGASSAASAIFLNAAGPFIRWRESDQAVDTSDWLWGPSSSAIQLSAITDAGTAPLAGGVAFRADRTAGTANISSIRLGNTTTNPALVFASSGWTVSGSEGSAGDVLRSGGTGVTPTWAAPASQVAGSDTQVQFNNAGAFGADAGMTYVSGTDTLSVGTVTAATAVTVAGNNVCQSTGTNCPTTGSANPTASVGLSATNGVATSYMRSDAAPSLSQSITPTWSGTHIFSNASTGVYVQSITPGLRIEDTDAGVDGKQWLTDVNAGNYRIATRTDAGGAGAVPLQMNRTGTTVDEIDITATNVDANGIFRSIGTNQLLGSAAFTSRTIGVATQQIQVEGNNNATSSLSLVRNNPSSGGGFITLGHSRGAAVGGTTIVNNNDILGFIDFAGADGVDMASLAATIVGTVDGTPGTDDMPGRLVFQTTPDGSATSVERMRINNVGALGFAGANFGTSGQVLVSGGSTTTPAWTTAPSQVAGSDTQVQFNNAGAFGADAGMTYVSGTDTLSIGTVTAATAVTVAGNNVCQSTGTNCPLTESSGTFTATFDDGCTTSPTVAFQYRKIGTIVTLNWDNMSPTTCTSDSITFDTNALNEVPAAIRPTSTQNSVFMPVIDNSIARSGEVTVTPSGNIQMRLCIAEGGAATGLVCSVNLWTNANLKSIQAGTMTYSTAW